LKVGWEGRSDGRRGRRGRTGRADGCRRREGRPVRVLVIRGALGTGFLLKVGWQSRTDRHG
jgi:hypothetical protein